MIPTCYFPLQNIQKEIAGGLFLDRSSTARIRGDRYWNVMLLQMMNQFMYAWQECNSGPEGIFHAAALFQIGIQDEWNVPKG